MNTSYVIPETGKRNATWSRKALRLSTQLWLLVAVIGQWFFVYHIVTFYGGTYLSGETESWSEVMYKGLIEGDLLGNFFLYTHLLLAAVISFGGPLQLMPFVRKKLPVFHRWVGRIYIPTAFVISIAGLYMVLARGVVGGPIMAAGNVLNASLIMICAWRAYQTARARDFVAHRPWALRLFMMVSGVWFFRIGFGLWIFLNGGSSPGVNEDFTGPFIYFLAFAHSLLPLGILEAYLFFKDKVQTSGRFLVAAGIFLLTIFMGIGIFMAAMIFWMS